MADVRISHAEAVEFSENDQSFRVNLSIENRGDADDRLIDASVSFADHVQLQRNVLGVQRVPMETDVEAITITAGRPSRMYQEWIQFEGIQKAFRHGQSFGMEVTFEKTGTVSVKVKVRCAAQAAHVDPGRCGSRGRR